MPAPATPQQILQNLPAGVSLAQVARVAGFSERELYRLRAGQRTTTNPDTLARLKLAITRIRNRREDGPAIYEALYKALLVICAAELQVAISDVHAYDPARRRVNDALWMQCSRVHWLARYLMGPGLGVSVSDVARAAGATKQAVSLSLKEVELMRDEVDFETRVARLEAQLLGSDW